MENLNHYFENKVTISAPAEKVFNFADDNKNFSAHMNSSSWMMGGGKMETKVDEGHGQRVGSHIRMKGNAFGIKLSLDEVVTKHQPPRNKEWATVGKINLMVIGHYILGFDIKPMQTSSEMKVYIKYELPNSIKTRWLGYLFGDLYAKWCVNQMIKAVRNYFS